MWPERTPFSTSLDRRENSISGALLARHPQSAYHSPNLFQTLFKENMPHFLFLQQTKTSAAVSVTSNDMFMYFCRELRKRSGLTEAVVSIPDLEGLDVAPSQNWIIFGRVVIKLVQAASLIVKLSPSYESFIWELLHFPRVSTGNANQQWVLLKFLGKLKCEKAIQELDCFLRPVKYLMKYPLTYIWSSSSCICVPQATERCGHNNNKQILELLIFFRLLFTWYGQVKPNTEDKTPLKPHHHWEAPVSHERENLSP